MGVVFVSFGLFPLTQVPLTDLTNCSVDLSEINRDLGLRLEERIYRARTVAERVATLENDSAVS